MNEKNSSFLRNEFTIITALSPIVMILERMMRTLGINIILLIQFAIIAASVFIAVWFIVAVTRKGIFLLLPAGLLICAGTLLLWLIWKELIVFYLLGISLLILHLLLTLKDNPQLGLDYNTISLIHFLYFQTIVCIGLTWSFFLAVFFWNNIVMYIVVGIQGLLLIFYAVDYNRNKSMRKLQYKELAERELKGLGIMGNLKLLGFVLVAGLAPSFLAVLLFLLFYGYIIFLPVDFTQGKFLIAIFFGVLGYIFAKLVTKLERNALIGENE